MGAVAALRFDPRSLPRRATIHPARASGQPLGCLSVFPEQPDRGRLPGASVEASMVGVALANAATRVSQHGAAIELRPGEWTFYAPQALARVEAHAGIRVVFVPRAELGEAAAYLPGGLLDRFSSDQPINRVTFSMLSAVCDHASGFTPGCAHAVALAAVHVLKNALIERAGQRRHGAPLLRRVKDLLEWRLRDPELAIGALAQAVGCTERSVQRAFQTEGETFQRYVLRRRLERCREDLTSPALSHQSVTDIAFSYGFNSLAHFSRAYKEQFGHSPSAARTLATARAAGR